MAKWQKSLRGMNFLDLVHMCEISAQNSGTSASYEDGYDFQKGHVKLAVRVYERYSALGGNRVSLHITVLDDGEGLTVSAITSGGSTGVFKVVGWGEEEFLNEFKKQLENEL